MMNQEPTHYATVPGNRDETTADQEEQSAQLAELREGFDLADLNGDGRLELDEFIAFASDLIEGSTRQELRIGFAEIDRNHNGTIDFDEFAAWWTGLQ